MTTPSLSFLTGKVRTIKVTTTGYCEAEGASRYVLLNTTSAPEQVLFFLAQSQASRQPLLRQGPPPIRGKVIVPLPLPATGQPTL
jgi:hypothetical protein